MDPQPVTTTCRSFLSLQESHRALMTKDLMNSGLLRDRYVADLFERLQVRGGAAALGCELLDSVCHGLHHITMRCYYWLAS